MRKANLQQVSAWNRRVVLDVMRQQQPLSRAELARQTGLEAATTSRLVGSLIKAGLVEETGKAAISRGRRPMQLRLSDSGPGILVIDLHHQYLEFSMLTSSNRILGHRVVPVPSSLSADALERLIDENLDVRGGQSLLGVAVKSTGIVNTPTGVIHRTPCLSDGDFAIRERLIEALGVPVLVEASSRIEAWAEADDAGLDDVFVLWLGVGVGSGIVSAGQIVRGAAGSAGEIGHTRVATGGKRQCSLGHRGCLESATRIQTIEAELSALRSEAVSYRDLDALVGDKACRKMVDGRLDLLLNAVAPVIDALDPARVVLKGELAEASDHVMKHIAAGLRKRCSLTRSQDGPEVVRSRLHSEDIRRKTADLFWSELLGLEGRPIGELSHRQAEETDGEHGIFGVEQPWNHVLGGSAS